MKTKRLRTQKSYAEIKEFVINRLPCEAMISAEPFSRFYEKYCEFTGLDSNNYKSVTASMRRNLNKMKAEGILRVVVIGVERSLFGHSHMNAYVFSRSFVLAQTNEQKK